MSNLFPIRLIKAGLNLDKSHFYPKEILQSSVSKYDGAKVFSYFDNGIFDHAPKGKEDKKNLIGIVDNPRWCDDFEGLIADFHCIDRDIKASIEECHKKKLKDFVKFSSDHNCMVHTETIEGNEVSYIDNISQVNELTIVTHPNCGGEFLRLFESQRNKKLSGKEVEKKMRESEPLIETLRIMLNMIENKNDHVKLESLGEELIDYQVYLSNKDKESLIYCEMVKKLEEFLPNKNEVTVDMSVEEVQKYATEHKLSYEDACSKLYDEGKIIA